AVTLVELEGLTARETAELTDIEVRVAPQSAEVVGSWLPGAERFIASATIEARKPGAATSCCGPSCCA
ncbi:MAG TPA: hypothetical protein VL172_19445, partial [Kofleriaceae bacterium]|nr:hypothetical protein [Kofleriaceae bacterium]